MSETPPPAGPVDLEALDRFLMSDASPEDCMQLSDLDGFLTGIAIGPEPVPPSEWLPVVWGGEEPVFDDAEQARTVIGLIMTRYSEVLRVLDTDPGAYAPDLLGGPGRRADRGRLGGGLRGRCPAPPGRVAAAARGSPGEHPADADHGALRRARGRITARSGGEGRPPRRGGRRHPGVRGGHPRVLERPSRSTRGGCRPGEEPQGRSQRPVPLRLRSQVQALLRRELNGRRWRGGHRAPGRRCGTRSGPRRGGCGWRGCTRTCSWRSTCGTGSGRSGA